MAKVQIFGERRLHQRKACAFPVTLDDRRDAYRCIIRNLSLGGALIEPPPNRQPKVGQEFLITIPYRRKKDSVVIKGKIDRIDGNALGIVFLRRGR
jgi:hypothetical protein